MWEPTMLRHLPKALVLLGGALRFIQVVEDGNKIASNGHRVSTD